MKNKHIILYTALLMMGCNDEEVNNNKDLGQNMMDLRIYQENLGDYIKAEAPEKGDWLLEGMDSILLILNKKYKEHPKLSAPFSYYYKKDLKEPLNNIREAIRNSDKASALRNYRILITNCNDCHIDHEIEKEVKF